jgi:hypothetical protein
LELCDGSLVLWTFSIFVLLFVLLRFWFFRGDTFTFFVFPCEERRVDSEEEGWGMRRNEEE